MSIFRNMRPGLVSFVGIGMLTVPASAANLATWLAEWDPPSATGAAQACGSEPAIVWTRSLDLSSDATAVQQVYTPAMIEFRESLGSRPKLRYGPTLSNSDSTGFNPELGLKLLRNPKPVLQQLRKLAVEQGWRVFNLDLESLPKESYRDYDSFLDLLLQAFSGLDIRVSVNLAPIGDSLGDDASFMHLSEISKRDVDIVLMAYDYSWAKGPPGPVAPLDWVKKLTRRALDSVGAKRLTVALPLYGYHWKKEASGTSWQGVPRLPTEIRMGSDRWKKDRSFPIQDGYLFKLEETEVIAYDDTSSFLAKRAELEKMGVQNFAFWRMGAEDAKIYTDCGKNVPQESKVPSDCTSETMDSFRRSAQSMDDATPRLADPLLSCPQLREEASWWLSYYYHVRGDYAKSSEARRLHSEKNLKEGFRQNSQENYKEEVFAAAVSGNYHDLEKKVDAGAPGFAGDAESLLILARSLIQAEKGDESRARYRQYLDIKPDDLDVRIESLYSYAWEGSYDESKEALEKLLAQAVTSEQRDKLQKAIEYVNRQKDTALHGPAVNSEEPQKSGRAVKRVQSGVEVYHSADDFSRRSMVLDVGTVPLDLHFSLDQLATQEGPGRTGMEIFASKFFRMSGGSSVQAKGGVYAASQSTGEYDLRIDPWLGSEFKPFFGVYRMALVKDILVPDTGVTWTRNGVGVGFNYDDSFEYRFDYRNTSMIGVGTDHNALARLVLDQGKSPAEKLNLILVGEYQTNEQYNPYIYSPKSLNCFGVGVEFKKTFSNRLKGGFQGIYGQSTETPGNTAVTGVTGVSADRYLLNGDLEYELKDHLVLELDGRIVRSSSALGGDFYRSSLLAVKLEWRLDKGRR